jgi:hypothetical protein
VMKAAMVVAPARKVRICDMEFLRVEKVD